MNFRGSITKTKNGVRVNVESNEKSVTVYSTEKKVACVLASVIDKLYKKEEK